MPSKPKIEITPKLLQQAEQLAAKGYPTSLISEALGIGRSTIYTKPYQDIIDAIKKGRTAAKMIIIDTLMARSISDMSPTALIFLTKQLKVFDTYFATSKPNSAAEAVGRIAGIYEAVSRNELEADKGDRLVAYLQSYIKGLEVSELEQRLNELEKRLSNDKD